MPQVSRYSVPQGRQTSGNYGSSRLTSPRGVSLPRGQAQPQQAQSQPQGQSPGLQASPVQPPSNPPTWFQSQPNQGQSMLNYQQSMLSNNFPMFAARMRGPMPMREFYQNIPQQAPQTLGQFLEQQAAGQGQAGQLNAYQMSLPPGAVPQQVNGARSMDPSRPETPPQRLLDPALQNPSMQVFPDDMQITPDGMQITPEMSERLQRQRWDAVMGQGQVQGQGQGQAAQGTQAPQQPYIPESGSPGNIGQFVGPETPPELWYQPNPIADEKNQRKLQEASQRFAPQRPQQAYDPSASQEDLERATGERVAGTQHQQPAQPGLSRGEMYRAANENVSRGNQMRADEAAISKFDPMLAARQDRLFDLMGGGGNRYGQPQQRTDSVWGPGGRQYPGLSPAEDFEMRKREFAAQGEKPGVKAARAIRAAAARDNQKWNDEGFTKGGNRIQVNPEGGTRITGQQRDESQRTTDRQRQAYNASRMRNILSGVRTGQETGSLTTRRKDSDGEFVTEPNDPIQPGSEPRDLADMVRAQSQLKKDNKKAAARANRTNQNRRRTGTGNATVDGALGGGTSRPTNAGPTDAQKSLSKKRFETNVTDEVTMNAESMGLQGTDRFNYIKERAALRGVEVTKAEPIGKYDEQELYSKPGALKKKATSWLAQNGNQKELAMVEDFLASTRGETGATGEKHVATDENNLVALMKKFTDSGIEKDSNLYRALEAYYNSSLTPGRRNSEFALVKKKERDAKNREDRKEDTDLYMGL